MPRNRPPARSNQGKPATEPPAASGQPVPLLALLLFGAAALIELLLYFRNGPDQHLEQRLKSLLFLTAPDQLFVMWCGGKLAYFSLLDRWPIALLAITTLAGAWLAGRLALSALRLRTVLDWLERQVFAIAIGLNLLSLYALAVGLAGGLQHRWLFVAPVILLLVANLRVKILTGRLLSPVPCSLSPVPCPPSAHTRRATLDDARWLWWLLAALPFTLVIVLGSMLPPWAYDVREYHLQAPKEWFQNGRIDFLPHNIYANMPLGSELTALWGMALAGGKDGWWWGAMSGKTVMTAIRSSPRRASSPSAGSCTRWRSA
jgi:hypothetical protein